MTKTQTDGGPAFAHGNREQGGDPGMSLRDYFAGQALISMGTWMPPHARGSSDPLATPQLYSEEAMRARAEWAYGQADAMLAARETDND